MVWTSQVAEHRPRRRKGAGSCPTCAQPDQRDRRSSRLPSPAGGGGAATCPKVASTCGTRAKGQGVCQAAPLMSFKTKQGRDPWRFMLCMMGREAVFAILYVSFSLP